MELLLLALLIWLITKAPGISDARMNVKEDLLDIYIRQTEEQQKEE